MLTKFQELLLEYIKEYWWENFEMPSTRTMAKYFKNVSSPQTINNHVHVLLDMEKLKYRNPEEKRGLCPYYMFIDYG